MYTLCLCTSTCYVHPVFVYKYSTCYVHLVFVYRYMLCTPCVCVLVHVMYTLCLCTGTCYVNCFRVQVHIMYTVFVYRYGFVLPPNQIIPSGEEMWAGFEVVIKKLIEVSEA